MRVFFLSTQRCALKINGVFLGYIDGVERFVTLYPRDENFCELIPVDGNFCPLSFVFCESILSAPPTGVQLYRLTDGIALYACNFFVRSPRLTLLDSRFIDTGKVTLFLQGVPQLLLEREGTAQTVTLDERFIDGKIIPLDDMLFIEGRNAVYLLDNALNEVYYDRATAYHYDRDSRVLTVVTPLAGVGGRTATCVFCKDGERVTMKNCSLSPLQNYDENHILCAFLQSFLYGEGDEFLCDDLQGCDDDLHAFFGDYVAGIPLPNTPFGAGMVRPKGNKDGQVFCVEKWIAEVENHKIKNIKRQG